MGKLTYSLSGLSEFIVNFEEWCVPCPYQKNCKWNKSKPFTVLIDCKDLTNAFEFLKNKEMEKLGKKNPNMDWEERAKKAKVGRPSVYSEIWNDKVKKIKDDLVCMNSKKIDSMLTSKNMNEWWTEFREVMKKIDEECQKQ